MLKKSPKFALPPELTFQEERERRNAKLAGPGFGVKVKDGKIEYARVILPIGTVTELFKKGDKYDWRAGNPPNERFLKIFPTKATHGLTIPQDEDGQLLTVSFSVISLIDPHLRKSMETEEVNYQTVEHDKRKAIVIELPADVMRPTEQ